jgi:hypothetical protein
LQLDAFSPTRTQPPASYEIYVAERGLSELLTHSHTRRLAMPWFRWPACLGGGSPAAHKPKRTKTTRAPKRADGFDVIPERHQKEPIYVLPVWEEDCIHLVSDTGVALKTLPLSSTEWSTCRRPLDDDARDCIVLKYKEKSPVQMVLRCQVGCGSETAERLLQELEQSRALATSMGMAAREDDEAHDELRRLRGRMSDLSKQLDVERGEFLCLQRECARVKGELERRDRQQVYTPDQMQTCLARIEELERANDILREDSGIQMRREKGFVGQLAMVRAELERQEDEKSALMSSLETALTMIHQLKKS